MKKILNPYPKYEGYNCFGCSPNNDNGLRMEFFEDGDEVICNWQPSGFLQGYHNVLHGGIQATLMDEIGSWFVQVKLKTAGVTSNLNVRYINPVSIVKGDILLKASLIRKRKNLVDVLVRLFDSNEKLCAKGEITYFTFSPDIAKRELYYPEFEEFFEKK
jgi:uncharacterized protein (TIGR00369 family)